ncbi:FAD/NAD(P)-binding domain-containing protein [Mycena venus]|uniref:FAD/NAD(P)-binding domain-containing protein n=1 Tax=Mycena venus TaxID=2733690 RepID=A0A8H6X988_9AGAR|nr:FAD/NAD(P)-binding domain-containing protein [Mycena venus]
MASDSSNVLNIAVVGAGIAGLTAAIALRRNGHLVQIFESSENKTEIGAALGVPLNALRVLDHLGISRENLKGVPVTGAVFLDPKSGEGQIMGRPTPNPAVAQVSPPVDGKEPAPTPLPQPAQGNPPRQTTLFCHRSDLYEELKRLAIGEGEGPPVKLRLGAKILACDPEDGNITLNSGDVVRADLVVGADGVNSIIRTHVTGEVKKVSPSGVCCFRTVFQFPTVREKPELQWLTEGVSGPRAAIAREGPFRMLLFYPCRNGTLLNFIGFYTDTQEGGAGWKPTASRDDLIDKFADFHPKFLSVMDLPLHSEIIKWQLGVMPFLPTWIRGRAALLGDAAHATLPFLAQGAAMAIEEGGSIGCLFPAGTKPADVPERLAAYQDIRKERGEFVRTESLEQLSRLKNGGQHGKFQEIQAYLFRYDAIATAQACYEERFGDKLPSK